MPVGETLAAERRKQSKSITEVVAATNIIARLINALEAGRYDELPQQAYVRGYIQSYAKFLGMPAAPLLKEYEADLGAGKPRTRLEEVPERTVVPMRDQMHHIPMSTWLTIVIAIIGIGFVLWLVGTVVNRSDAPLPIPPETTTSTIEPTETVPGVATDTVPASDTVGAEGSGSTSSTVDDQTFVLKVDVAEGAASWLRVTVDGLKAYEGTLSGGQTKEWTVTKDAEVQIGKPDDVTVTRDGEAVTPKSKNGIGIVTLSTTAE
jgi:cytoskeletal protein RodZ